MDKILIPVLDRRGHGLLAGIIFLAVALPSWLRAEGRESGSDFRGALPARTPVACAVFPPFAMAAFYKEAQPACVLRGEACAKACAELLGIGRRCRREKDGALSTAWAAMTAPATKCATTASWIAAPHLPLLAGGISSCRYGCMAWATALPCANTAQSTSATAWRQSTPQVPRLRKMHRCMSEGAHQLWCR